MPFTLRASRTSTCLTIRQSLVKGTPPCMEHNQPMAWHALQPVEEGESKANFGIGNAWLFSVLFLRNDVLLTTRATGEVMCRPHVGWSAFRALSVHKDSLGVYLHSPYITIIAWWGYRNREPATQSRSNQKNAEEMFYFQTHFLVRGRIIYCDSEDGFFF